MSWFTTLSLKTKLLLVFVGLVVFFALIPSGESSPTPQTEPDEIAEVTEEPEESGTALGEDESKPEEEKYLNAVAIYSQGAAEASGVIAELLGTWPAWSDNDVLMIAAATLSIENTYDLFKELSPPKKFASVHQKLLKGTKLAADAMPILRESVDNADAALMAKYTEMTKQATKLINEAVAEMEKLK